MIVDQIQLFCFLTFIRFCQVNMHLCFSYEYIFNFLKDIYKLLFLTDFIPFRDFTFSHNLLVHFHHYLCLRYYFISLCPIGMYISNFQNIFQICFYQLQPIMKDYSCYKSFWLLTVLFKGQVDKFFDLVSMDPFSLV